MADPEAASRRPERTEADPASVVRQFLELLQAGDVDSATELLDPDVAYQNVSLPTLNGRDRVRKVFRRLLSNRGGFEVYFHTVAAEGGSVLTERTDVLRFGRLRVQLWVCGRFDVHQGRIVLWRDYFDFWNTTVALLRGLVGIVVPAASPRPPSAAR